MHQLVVVDFVNGAVGNPKPSSDAMTHLAVGIKIFSAKKSEVHCKAVTHLQGTSLKAFSAAAMVLSVAAHNSSTGEGGIKKGKERKECKMTANVKGRVM
jgi:hypothetical protein